MHTTGNARFSNTQAVRINQYPCNTSHIIYNMYSNVSTSTSAAVILCMLCVIILLMSLFFECYFLYNLIDCWIFEYYCTTVFISLSYSTVLYWPQYSNIRIFLCYSLGNYYMVCHVCTVLYWTVFYYCTVIFKLMLIQDRPQWVCYCETNQSICVF